MIDVRAGLGGSVKVRHMTCLRFGRIALGSGSHFKINDGVVGQSKSIFTDVDRLCEEFLKCLRAIVRLLTHCMTYTR